MQPHPWFERFPDRAVLAHRGASRQAPENTLAAFELAVSQGADAIELDVETCAGGDLVVIHDATVDRTTDGSGKVSKLPLQAIRELDAGSWFDPRFKGESVPTLDEVLEAVGKRIFINIELKNYTSWFDDLAEKVALSVKRHGLEKQVLFSSFNPFNFRVIKRHLPKSPVGLLAFRGFASPWFVDLVRKLAPFDSLNPHHLDVSPQLIEHNHKAGMPVFAYTVNDAADIRRLLDAGMDGVITDDPELGLSIARIA